MGGVVGPPIAITPIFWSYVPNIARVSDTSGRPQNDVGKYLGPSTLAVLGINAFWFFYCSQNCLF